ncbi:MAG: type II secretion system F family protein, partial [Planctomycetota bacterium]
MDTDYRYIIFIISSLLSGAFAGWALVVFFQKAKKARELAREEIIVTETESSFFKSLMPFARIIGRYFRGTFGNKDHNAGFYNKNALRIKNRLASAGMPEGINEDEYVGFSVINIFMFGICGVLCYILFDLFDSFIMFFMGCFIGFLRMPLWLKGKTERRHLTIKKELPFSLDLLTLAMEAGLDFTNALDRIVKKLKKGPLGQEYSIMLREITLGKSRSEAMRDLGRRVGIAEVQSVMTSLVQAEEMGASIGPILRIQAEQQ